MPRARHRDEVVADIATLEQQLDVLLDQLNDLPA